MCQTTRFRLLSFCYLFSFFKDFIYLLTEGEGKGGRKRRRETSVCDRHIDWLPLTRPQPGTWPATRALTSNQTRDPLVCRLALNPPSHTSQGFLRIFNKIALWLDNVASMLCFWIFWLALWSGRQGFMYEVKTTWDALYIHYLDSSQQRLET